MVSGTTRTVLTSLLCLTATGAVAENFTTAAEVKPILQATKPQWIAVRNYDGQDLLYFTNLLSWRCGLTEVFYGVNGGEMVPFVMEPCYLDTAQPNALKAESLDAILVSFPPGSIETVDLNVTFDDGTAEQAHYERKAVEIQ
ncbi:hypothetical protein [Celeribacter sp. HF31]|uniref:hypothetical protein n=1 Tax=Celeribacter sp. HF31 TaxID=2721558 RepID=UPI001C3779EE|nr:hypothetical protein [Celeribacter sp. HF31]